VTELSIDTASDIASIALSRDGVVTAEKTWRCERNHTVELMPAIDALLAANGDSKPDVSAVFVCAGPGMYTGLRVGVSVAKGIAYALEIPIVGIGRLAADAYPHAKDGRTVIAVHRAGRSEYAWGAYAPAPWRATVEPRLDKADALASRAASVRALVVGEVDEELGDAIISSGGAEIVPGTESFGRATAIAELAWARLSAGDADEAALLAPVYLRSPAIGPQPPHTGQ
jgi:tRNA threonylcarbamoyladenosine biosynthesis protein TsaB